MERKMKDSGIPWIGEIPDGWNVSLIGSCIKEVDCKNTDGKEDNALQFKMGTIISKRNGDSKYNPETLEAYNIVKVGDIIINGLNLSFDLISQRVGLVKENGVITSTYIAVRPTTNISNEFLTYLFKAYDNCKAFHSMGRGLRQTLSYGELRKYYVVLPLKEEQQRIAEFLDRKCGEIDEMIALQEEFIEELKAYKQSVITEAVTRGLNPNVEIKKSDMEWIDCIPSHWKEVRFYKSNNIRGRLGWKGLKADEYTESGYPFLSAFNIINDKLSWEDLNFINQERYDESPEIKLSVGDLLIVKDGAGIGKCARIDQLPLGEATVNSSLAVITPSKSLYYAFLYYYMLSVPFQHIIWLLKIGMGVPHLTQENMHDIDMTCPPLDEQRQIADYLDKKCGEIDGLIDIKQQKIEELKDYKKSIIYEYVTGKKEVNV